MKAVQIVGPRLAKVVDVEEPSLNGVGRIKVRMERACLCGSDSPLFNYDFNALAEANGRDPSKQLFVPFVDLERGDPYPLQAGLSIHECLGTVVESTSNRFKEGDFVLALPDHHDGLVEYMCASDRRAIPLPKNAVSKEEILMTQPLGTVVWATQKLGNIVDWDTVVVGQGPMGLMISHMLAHMGARTVIGMDRVDDRLEVAKKMRATHTVNVDREDPVAAVAEITDGRLAGLVVEAVGHQMETVGLCMQLARRLGTVLCFGVPDYEHYQNFPYSEFFRKNLKMMASVGADVVPNFSLARDLIAQGRVDVSPLVTHILPFEEIQKGYELFVDRKDGAIKVVIDYESLK